MTVDLSTMRRVIGGAGAGRLAGHPETAGNQAYRRVFNSQAGAERGSGISTIIHHQFRPLPSAHEVDGTPPLPDKNLRFDQAKFHQTALGSPPAAINGAAQLEGLGRIPRGTEAARALHAAGGPHAIEVKLGRMRRRVEINE